MTALVKQFVFADTLLYTYPGKVFPGNCFSSNFNKYSTKLEQWQAAISCQFDFLLQPGTTPKTALLRYTTERSSEGTYSLQNMGDYTKICRQFVDADMQDKKRQEKKAKKQQSDTVLQKQTVKKMNNFLLLDGCHVGKNCTYEAEFVNYLLIAIDRKSKC